MRIMKVLAAVTETNRFFVSPAPRSGMALAALLLLTLNPNSLFAQGTAFTYQGKLSAGTGAANGNYDMQFYLRDALTAGNPVGVTNTISPVAVSNGLFTVVLDFGANFPGADRWLEIGVRTNGAASYTPLSPRQKLTPAPYAITAGNLSGALPTSQLTGTLPSALFGGTYSGAVTLNNAADIFTGSGAGLTSLNANNLSSGTVADARLSANVALLNRSPQTFTGQNIFNSSVGIGTASPAAPLHVKQGSGSGVPAPSAALVADGQASSYGVWGGSGAANGSGVAGECDNGPFASGVYGTSSSGFGVYGSGARYGLYGLGGTFGVYGAGTSVGGSFQSAGGTGLFAAGNPAIEAVGNVGIGTGTPTAPLHVRQGSGSGVMPASAAIVADAQTNTDGIWGASAVANGNGVVGECDQGQGAYGVWGRSTSGRGVSGEGGPYGVWGSGSVQGVTGLGGTYGVYGSGDTDGVYGSGPVGVYGQGTGYGVYGRGGLYGVYGQGTSFGGYFASVSGTALYAEGDPAIQTSGRINIVSVTATAADNTASFYDPSLGPNYSHIHWGTTGDWYIRSAADAGKVVIQDQSASAYVGIGTSTPFYKLDVNGIIRGNNVSPSDARWKKNIAPLTNALDTIEQLRGVRYEWRADEFPKINFEPGPQIGLIAQEVKKILPEAVSQDREGFYSVAYTKLIPVLVEGMKEQQGQLRAKDARVAALEKANDEMRLELAAQKELTRRMQAEFVTLQKAVARIADKSASTVALNPQPAEAK